MASGMCTVVIWGWIEFGNLMGGLEMITMMCFGNHDPEPSDDGAPGCGFYARRAAMIFPLIVLVTFVVTMVVSYMDRSLQALDTIAKHYSVVPSTTEAWKEWPSCRSPFLNFLCSLICCLWGGKCIVSKPSCKDPPTQEPNVQTYGKGSSSGSLSPKV